jgi:indole-3-glycerol phosphate synthase
MGSTLDQIVNAARVRVSELIAGPEFPAKVSELERKADLHSPRGFRRNLADVSRTRPAVIAELKKASPSRGLIRENFNPPELAVELESAGAAALSVLTDGGFFQGSLENLHLASQAVTLPCLRKDFIVDEFQLLEARAYGADAILLIVAALSQTELVTLARRAADHELDVLCEVHDDEELSRALDAGCNLVGVNSRDLKTFQVDLRTPFRLAERIPANVLAVAESGIQNAADITRLRLAGYRAFLIGETLMKAQSPGEMLRKLIWNPQATSL